MVLLTLPNGNLASGSWDRTVKIWDSNNGSLLFNLIGHENNVDALTALPHGILASGSYDKTIKIWSL